MKETPRNGLILLNIGYAEPGPLWNWPNVYSPYARIYFVTSGRARTRINGVVYDLEPGNLYLTPPFTLHDDESDGDFALFYIHFYDNSPNREGVFNKYVFPVNCESKSYDSVLVERLLEINPGRQLRDIDPQHYDNDPEFTRNIAHNKKVPRHISLETSGILEILLSRFLKQAVLRTADKDPRIVAALQYIHQHTDGAISLCGLAESAYLTPDHFTRLFRKETGYSPVAYINHKKIERAQLLLLTTELHVKEVATMLSIDNVPYFNRLFKSVTGLTPGNYRRHPEGGIKVQSKKEFYDPLP